MSKTTPVMLLFAVSLAAGPSVEADARRGAEFFQENKCTSCHAPGTARDLARRLDRNYTPAALTSEIWNHAPAMFGEMRRQGFTPPAVSDQQSADLFAFFYSRRYFERPGDAARGKAAFEEKGCAGCHAIKGSSTGPAVSTWGSLTDPVALVGAMWNHAPKMKEAIASKGGKWPELTSQNMADILVYVQNQPVARKAGIEFLLPPVNEGKAAFDQRCGGCHQGAASLENKLRDETLTDVAVAMWNHAPLMRQSAPDISEEDMRKIMGFAWASQFMQPHGNADRGKRVFESKKCASCHGEQRSAAPNLANLPKPFNTMNMVSVIFGHGPAMEKEMKAKGTQWPTLSAREMADLTAYLAK